MSRWFRVYSDLVDDPKFIKLGPDLRSALLMLWCIAGANDGSLPGLDHIAIKFRLSEKRTKMLLDELERSGFIDRDGDQIVPHNWAVRQFKSDTSNERVKRYRKQHRNVTVTPPETETDTETDTEQKDNARVARSPDRFEEFWESWPKRVKRALSHEKFKTAVKRGTPPETIIAAAKRFAEEERAKGTEDKFIPAAAVWLNQKRWLDYEADPPPEYAGGWRPGLPTAEELREKYAREAEAGRVPQGGACPRPEDQGVVCDEQRVPGVRKLGEILRPGHWGKAPDVPDGAAGPDEDVDSPRPISRMV